MTFYSARTPDNSGPFYSPDTTDHYTHASWVDWPFAGGQIVTGFHPDEATAWATLGGTDATETNRYRTLTHGVVPVDGAHH